MELGKMFERKLRERYEKKMADPCSSLGLLSLCDGPVFEVSAKLDYGLAKEELIDLCIGYVFGADGMKEKVLDFLEDINFHSEYARLEDDAEGFLADLIIGGCGREVDIAREEIWALAGKIAENESERNSIVNRAFAAIGGSGARN